MADKLTKQQVSIRLILHLEQYAQRVAEVVDDYNAMQNEREMPDVGKREFAIACMKDVAHLTGLLTQFVKDTMDEGGIRTPDIPNTVALPDIVALSEYKAKGGLLN
jgi:hypothetical protein